MGTSEWIIEEVGYAIGNGRKILLLVERDVHFPPSDLNADVERIPFERDKLSDIQSKLNQMILVLINERVQPVPKPASIANSSSSPPEKENEKQEPTFVDKIDAIQKAVLECNYSEADKVQEELLAVFRDKLSYNFVESHILKLRASKDDQVSLESLKKKCADNPKVAEYILALADVFIGFHQFTEATALLKSHLDSVPLDQRSLIAIKVSECLCDDGKTTQAIPFLLTCLQKESNLVYVTSIFQEIARVAGKAKNPDLEIAFLEKVLNIKPTDNDVRFRLAYVYSENGLIKQSVYHYSLVVEHSDNSAASNNLGVAYGELGFKANECKYYKKVADRNSLAKSNLAGLYATAGFLSEAEEIAKTVGASSTKSESDDQQALNRARHVLDDIVTIVTKEKEEIGRIADETKVVREYMCEYAEAYCAPSLAEDKGRFATTFGDNVEIEIIRGLAELKGEGIIVKENALSGLINAVANPYSASAETNVNKYTVSISAKLQGQSGIFELTISPSEKPKPTSGLGLAIYGSGVPTRTIKGLMFFKNDGNTIQFLEQNEKVRTVFSAHRKSS